MPFYVRSLKSLITIDLLGINITNDKNNEIELKIAQEYLSKFKTNISLPNKNIDFYFSSKTETGITEESAYIISELSKEEFLGLVEQLDLVIKPDLFEFWPNAFGEDNNIKYRFLGWDVKNTPNEYTYYGKNPTKQIEMASRFENNKAFMRTKATKKVVTDENKALKGSEVLPRK